jgi:transposase-like protein
VPAVSKAAKSGKAKKMNQVEMSFIHRTCTQCKTTYTYEVRRQACSDGKRAYRQWTCPTCGKVRKAFGYRRSVETLVLTSKADMLVIDGYPILVPPQALPSLMKQAQNTNKK